MMDGNSSTPLSFFFSLLKTRHYTFRSIFTITQIDDEPISYPASNGRRELNTITASASDKFVEVYIDGPVQFSEE
jgi:hypothetical protein